MNRLPFFTVVMLATGILAWNFSFYRGYYQAQAAGSLRGHPLPVEPGEVLLRGGSNDSPAAHRVSQLVDGLQGAPPSGASGERGDLGLGGARPGTKPQVGPGVDRGRGSVGSDSGTSGSSTLEFETYAGGARRSEGRRVDGRREGTWAEWYEGGEPLSRGRYEDDLRDGRWLYWHPNGQPQHEGDYDAGRREGPWRSWHEDGEHMREGRYRDGNREGMWRQWYSNGQVMEAGRYVRGLREGWWEFYDFAGRSDKRAGWYEAGRRIR